MLFTALLAATWISGVNPELHTYNREGECGTGAVVPWAGSLWAVSYAPHAPNLSTDKLYEIKPDFTKIVHKESIGGTPANRMIHDESKQLFIGPYAIDAQGKVRTMPPMNADGTTNLYGRLTASARHLFEPAKKIYTMTMEEGVYEIDVDSLKVTELFRDGNIQGLKDLDGFLLPGYHGKGGYSGQGRLVYANNGEHTDLAMKDPTTVSGVLAQWNGKPGAENWQVVLRNQFTDITSKGGIHGAKNPETDPLWAIGWDYRSVMLMVLDDGVWHKYRLPKGSHSYDGAHGWNTEWPRIREIGEGDDFLMTMHGTFWHFPATMSAGNSAGIRPRSNYLKIVGDFCRWGDKVVLGCDDTAANEFMNKRRAKGKMGAPSQSNSSLWFLDPSAFDTFGPAIGRGAVWYEEDVKKGEISDPYLLDGFDSRTLYVAGDLKFEVEVDEKGDGKWTKVGVRQILPNIFDLKFTRGAWIRLVALADAKRVTAFFNYANRDRREISQAKSVESCGILRSGKGDEALPLEYGVGDALYLMLPENGELKLRKSTNSAERVDLEKWFRLNPEEKLGDEYDEASAIITDDDGRRWRFPRATEAPRPGRLCRECCTERDLLNLAGVIYELPAENAGGFAKVRAVAAPGDWMYDYCTWRGLFVISGLVPEGDFGKIVKSEDGQAQLWLGVADDLWKFGKPCGKGGPWKNTLVKKGVPSDPYLMTGFDAKRLFLESDKEAKITIELDITGTGTWVPFRTLKSAYGTNISNIRAYWLRAVADRDCKATVQLEYY